MNDRLLSDNQLSDAHIQGGGSLTGLRNVAAAQLAKTDKEWVAWVNEVFWFDHDGQTMGFNISGNKLYKLYQERRKEIGI